MRRAVLTPSSACDAAVVLASPLVTTGTELPRKEIPAWRVALVERLDDYRDLKALACRCVAQPIRMASILFAILFLGSLIHGGENAIRIALPQDNLTREERAPLQEYLSNQLKRPVAFVISGSYKDMIESLSNGSSEFALLGGLSYIQAQATTGVIPLVQSDKQFHSVFIAGVHSPIRSLADLRGKSFAFGDVNSTSGHLMPCLELKQAGISPEKDLKFRFSGSHPVTAALVESGAVDAGVLDEAFYKSLVESGKLDSKKVRIFYTSKPFWSDLFVAGKGVPFPEQERFTQALLSLKKGPDDKLLKLLRADRFKRATDDEYSNLRIIAKELNML